MELSRLRQWAADGEPGGVGRSWSVSFDEDPEGNEKHTIRKHLQMSDGVGVLIRFYAWREE